MRWNRGSHLPSLLGLALLGACGGGGSGDAGGPSSIEIDGSSTVFPITEAVAEEFMAETGGAVRVTVAMSGTGGGFKRFCAGETAISNASRAIEPEEVAQCTAMGVQPVELPIALDGLAVVVHPSNDFAQCLTVAELKRIWEPGSLVQTWADVRPEWPREAIKLYGPGTNSGTFDYFTEAIMGETDASRADYTASEDDNVLVQGVAGDPFSLGYFGYAYYFENKDQVRDVAVDGGSGCVTPTPETVTSGEYSPLSRPLFIYVADSALDQEAVRDFVQFYLESAPVLAPEVGYIPLGAEQYEQARQTFAQAADVPS